jgi:hypothetical protein
MVRGAHLDGVIHAGHLSGLHTSWWLVMRQKTWTRQDPSALLSIGSIQTVILARQICSPRQAFEDTHEF